jgi:hypothetical protein
VESFLKTPQAVMKKVSVALIAIEMSLKKLRIVATVQRTVMKHVTGFARTVGGKRMASKRSKACDISPKVRKEVLERDGKCIICGTTYGLQIAHYVSRARGGLGIPQNLAAMCVKCHGEMDNGKYHKEHQKAFREHLKAHYEGWNEKDLVYKKWSF